MLDLVADRVIPVVHIVELRMDSYFVTVAGFVELVAIIALHIELLLSPGVLHGHFFVLELVHVGHKFLASGEILDALVGFLLLLHQFDYASLDLRLLLLDLFGVYDSFHHVRLGVDSEG